MFCAAANAQQVFGSIFGTVTDSSGSAVVGAKVTVTDVNKGTQFEVTTDVSGNYNKGQLVPGQYTVTFESKGFGSVKSDVLDVRVNAAARYDALLKVGDISTQVEVAATAPLLQTDRSDVAQTFTAKEINDLPNIGRNLQAMELLNPGTAKIGWQHASDENPQNSVQMVVNGQLFSAMGYELDGTTNQDPILGIIVINPTFDSVEEVKQANQNFDAEFSYVGGGIASYSTKSGTNDFHGDVFEYMQLNTPGFTTFAADPFSGLPAATYRQNQFGGASGGRIIKNKLFYFGDIQINRQSQGASFPTRRIAPATSANGSPTIRTTRSTIPVPGTRRRVLAARRSTTTPSPPTRSVRKPRHFWPTSRSRIRSKSPVRHSLTIMRATARWRLTGISSTPAKTTT